MSDEQLKWEDVAPSLDRVKVPGGWIYRHFHFNGGAILVFVPDRPKDK